MRGAETGGASIVAASAALAAAPRARRRPPAHVQWSAGVARLRPYMRTRGTPGRRPLAAVYDGHEARSCRSTSTSTSCERRHRLDAEPEDQDPPRRPSHDMAAIERALRGAFMRPPTSPSARTGTRRARPRRWCSRATTRRLGERRRPREGGLRRGRAVRLTRTTARRARRARAHRGARRRVGGRRARPGDERSRSRAAAGRERAPRSRVIGDQSARLLVTDEVEIPRSRERRPTSSWSSRPTGCGTSGRARRRRVCAPAHSVGRAPGAGNTR